MRKQVVAVLMVLGMRVLNAVGARRVNSVVCRFKTEEAQPVMDPQAAQKLFSAKPGMLDLEFDCSSGFASPIRSYKEEHNVRSAFIDFGTCLAAYVQSSAPHLFTMRACRLGPTLQTTSSRGFSIPDAQTRRRTQHKHTYHTLIMRLVWPSSLRCR